MLVLLQIRCSLLLPAEWQFYWRRAYIFSCLHCLAISWLTMTSFALKSVVECTTEGCSNKSGDTNFHKFFPAYSNTINSVLLLLFALFLSSSFHTFLN